jgi:hypothetical protein
MTTLSVNKICHKIDAFCILRSVSARNPDETLSTEFVTPTIFQNNQEPCIRVTYLVQYKCSIPYMNKYIVTIQSSIFLLFLADMAGFHFPK